MLLGGPGFNPYVCSGHVFPFRDDPENALERAGAKKVELEAAGFKTRLEKSRRYSGVR
jgi:hypothetical protein